jgi:hypothetical protein
LWDPSELLGTGLPTLIVQGGSDPFGRPAEFPELPANVELVGIPGADHVFGVPGDRGAAMDLIVGSTGRWLGNLL